uniref:Uncharacterized protein n=1 Tax=Cacopsylla melanoneura TaxID=428564 RepID=A0A8D8TT32_9HEMI
MKCFLASVLLLHILTEHLTSANAIPKPAVSTGSTPTDTLLSRAQDDQLCNYGKQVKTLCTTVGTADKECSAIAKLVEGTDAKCIQQSVCSFCIGAKILEKKKQKRSLESIYDKINLMKQRDIKVEQNIVYITTDKSLCFEKKPGVVRICEKNLIIVNQIKVPDASKPPTQTQQPAHKGPDNKPHSLGYNNSKPPSPPSNGNQSTPPPSPKDHKPNIPSYNKFLPTKDNKTKPHYLLPTNNMHDSSPTTKKTRFSIAPWFANILQ